MANLALAMTRDLLQFALAMLVIFLPLMLSCLLMHLQERRRRKKRRPDAAKHG